MFKHRDNIDHPPFSVDPRGSGTVMKAVSFGQQQQQQQYGDKNNNLFAAAAKKRPRDIRGIERFKQVIYGEKGLPRFHAMIARNPVLMYPPEGIDAVRGRVQKRRAEEEKENAAIALASSDGCQQRRGKSKDESRPREGEEGELWAMFEERKAAEELMTPNDSQDAKKNSETVVTTTITTAAATATPVEDNVSSNQRARDEELSKYHHRQLDALLGAYYEFNHLTFMKLPMKDTLQLLQRCGKEAVAHTLEFEMQLRMQRETRLRELDSVAEEEKELKRRELEAQEKLLEMEMREAERMQRTLENEAEEEEVVVMKDGGDL